VLELLASHPDLTEAQVRDEVMTLLLAGHETTAMALTWALAAIDQRRRARSEPSGRPNRRHVQPVARRTRCP
jgi:cytochrome P450